MEIKDLAKRLAQQAPEVCRYLLPNGKMSGGKYRVGGIDGEEGKSLIIEVDGDKTGYYADFADDTGQVKGDLVDLWKRVKRQSLAEAMADISKYLGISEVVLHSPKDKEYKTPPPINSPVKGMSPVELYLAVDRLIRPEVQQAFKLEEVTKNGKNYIGFPSYSPSGKLLRYKWLNIERKEDGSKDIHVTPKDAAPCLFGWQALDPNTRKVVIEEGEINGLTLHQYGIPTLVVPFGAGAAHKNDWIEYEYLNLERFDTIYIRADNDEPGKKMVQDVAARLGKHRCRIFHMPHDPNECLQKGFTLDDIQVLWEESEYFHPLELHDPLDYVDDVVSEFYPSEVSQLGFSPKIAYLREARPHEHPRFAFRPGEWTLLTGIDSHGKSQMLDQFLLDGVHEGEKGCLASLEMTPKQVLTRQGKKILGVTEDVYPEPPQVKEAVRWLSGKEWIFDLMEAKTDLASILSVFDYAIRRFGVTICAIDNLMGIDGVYEESNDSQKEVAKEISKFVKRTNTHMILVAHPRKMENEEMDYDRMLVAGTKHLTNAADNVIIAQRNVTREKELANIDGKLTDDRMRDLLPQYTALCKIDKQRHGSNWKGYVKLWWHQFSMQFLDKYQGVPRNYLPKNI